MVFPRGRAEATLNVINYNENIPSKDPIKELIIIFGGVNDINTLNELWIFRMSTSTWSQIEIKGSPLLPRKGHSAVVFYNTTDENINSEIIRKYSIIVYGGKNDDGYLNNILIIDISYMVLQDTFFYKFITVESKGGLVPEKREVNYK